MEKRKICLMKIWWLKIKKKFDLIEKNVICCQRFFKAYTVVLFFWLSIFNLPKQHFPEHIKYIKKSFSNKYLNAKNNIFYFIIKSCFICKFFDVVFAYILWSMFATNSIVCKIIYETVFLRFSSSSFFWLQILFGKQSKKKNEA